MSTTSMEKKLVTTIESYVTLQKVRLEGTTCIFARQITSNFEVTRRINPYTGENIKLVRKVLISKDESDVAFPLKEVTVAQLTDQRRKGTPGFVLKKDGVLYVTEIPKSINLYVCSLFGHHKCSYGVKTCNRLSAASDEDGGCKKVRERSKRIERYPWILSGYETFNTSQNVFVVTECLNYEDTPPRTTLPSSKAYEMKSNLYEMYWKEDELFTF